MKKIQTIEVADISSKENLFFQHKGDVICLHDDVKGEIGWFEIWFDSENNDKEYLTLNNEIIYLEDLTEL